MRPCFWITSMTLLKILAKKNICYLLVACLQHCAQPKKRKKMKFVYLHGFNSSPQSAKATFVTQLFTQENIQHALHVPNLNIPTLSQITVSTQVQIVQQIIIEHCKDDEDVCLIGSSMGGYVAALVAARNKQVKHLILLCPAFNLAQRWYHRVGGAKIMEQWQETGMIYFTSDAQGNAQFAMQKQTGSKELHYLYYEDACKYEAFPVLPESVKSCQIVHGSLDDVVPVQVSQQMQQDNKVVQLTIVPDDHRLLNSNDVIAAKIMHVLKSE